MKNAAIGKRILILTSTLLVLVLGMGVDNYMCVQRGSKQIDVFKNGLMPQLSTISKINANFMLCYSRLLLATDGDESRMRMQLLDQANHYLAKASEHIGVYKAIIYDDEDRNNFAKLNNLLGDYLVERKSYTSKVESGAIEEAIAFRSSKLEPANADFRAQLDNMLAWNMEQGDVFAEQQYAAISSRANRTIILTVIVFLTAAGFASYIIRGINRQICAIAGSIFTTSHKLSNSSTQFSIASQSLADGANNQAASLEETSSSLEEISSMTKRNSENAQNAKTLASDASQVADEGVEEMKKMANAMNAIKASSDDISNIIKSIDDIAFQTNILALNAAVEAARAGEAGAGFAVVADEVRTLAQRSAQAARDTSSKIQDAIDRSEQGIAISTGVADHLSKIVEKVRNVDSFVVEIANSSNEQSAGIEQLNAAVSQIDQVTQKNAASAQATADASSQMKGQAEALNYIVERFNQLAGNRDGQVSHTAQPGHSVQTAVSDPDEGSAPAGFSFAENAAPEFDSEDQFTFTR